MGNHQETPSNQRALVLTLLAAILSTVFCAYRLLQIPADSKNAFLFGLSKERLIMLGGFAFLFLILLYCLITKKRFYSFLSTSNAAKPIILGIAVCSFFILMLPDYRFGRFAAIFIRLKSYILWFFLVSFLFSIYFLFIDDFSAVRETYRNLKNQKLYILITLILLILAIVFIELTGLGKTAETSLWNKNGIPLQSIQFFSAVVIFALFWKLDLFDRLGRNKTLLNFFLVWVISAIVWSFAPGMHHFFAPGPYEPNHTFYPYSDAAGYDLAAQTALNGWGFNFDKSLLKPTVVFMSFLSRWITGNDTTKSMLVQSAVYAVLPAIIYLFGSAVGGYSCGYLAAAFSILKEWNALRTRSVSTVHSRLVMSEFLIQILFALFCYAVFRWLKKNGKESLYAIITGGSFTLGILTRYNFLAFLPALLLILIIGYKNQFRRLLKPFLFFLISILMTAAPFIIRESRYSWNIFSEFKYTVENVLIRQRFNGEEPFGDDQKSSLSEEGSALQITEEHVLNKIEAEGTDLSDSIEESQTAIVTETSNDSSGSDPVDFNTSQITQKNSNNNSIKGLTIFESMINHGIHNIVSSFLMLPMELTFQDLHHLYTQEGDGLWRDHWQGDFSIRQWIMISIWILLGAVTIGILIKKQGLAGFSILYFWLVYACSIGFSRSSGGRYIVPINWIPMLLLAFCCTLFFSKGKISIEENRTQKLSFRKPLIALLGFTSFFGAMFIFEKAIPSKVTSVPEGDLAVLQERLSDQLNIDWDLVNTQYNDGTMHITHGVSIYPRYYYFHGGEHISSGALIPKEYSRMTFFGLNKENGSAEYHEYLMPQLQLIGAFPQDSIYRAISCSSSFGYEDVLAVTIDTPKGEQFTYIRDPLPDFSCPVPEPVCLSIENCY